MFVYQRLWVRLVSVDSPPAFLGYYDEVEICEEAARAHFKAAIQIRNRCMVDHSDLVVCCVQRKKGGAYQTVRYAEKVGKEVWNTEADIS